MKNRLPTPVPTPAPVSTGPMLNKGTLASFTTSKGKAIVMTENDFPALGKKPTITSASAVKPETSYAGLARDWAKKKQEEEENGKKMAESEATRAKLEYDDRVTRELRMKLNKVQLQHTQTKSNSLEEEEPYIPPPVDDYEYNTYVVQEEEEEEEEYDPTINYRRHKNELSNL